MAELRSASGLTVHILHEGRALCAKPGPPGNWGPYHKWVGRDTDTHGDRSNANCSGCVAGYKLWKQDPDSFFALMEAFARNASDATFAPALATMRVMELQNELNRWKSVAESLEAASAELGVVRLHARPLIRTRKLLRQLIDKWNASENDPRTGGGEVDMELLSDVVEAFEQEDEGYQGPKAPGPPGPRPSPTPCTPGCPGWDVFVTGEGKAICRCDECWAGRPDAPYDDEYERHPVCKAHLMAADVFDQLNPGSLGGELAVINPPRATAPGLIPIETDGERYEVRITLKESDAQR